jgi:hypothetical protein
MMIAIYKVGFETPRLLKYRLNHTSHPTLVILSEAPG